MTHSFESKLNQLYVDLGDLGTAHFVGNAYVTDNDAIAARLKSYTICGKEEGQGEYWLAPNGINGANRGRPRKIVSGARSTDVNS